MNQLSVPPRTMLPEDEPQKAAQGFSLPSAEDNLKLMTILIVARKFIHTASGEGAAKAWDAIARIINEEIKLSDFMNSRSYDGAEAERVFRQLEDTNNGYLRRWQDIKYMDDYEKQSILDAERRRLS